MIRRTLALATVGLLACAGAAPAAPTDAGGKGSARCVTVDPHSPLLPVNKPGMQRTVCLPGGIPPVGG